jgi:Holliday junction resolvase-like predicted endonuclease
MENYQHLSWDDIKGMYAETYKIFKEINQNSKEFDLRFEKIAQESEKTDERLNKIAQESEKTEHLIKNLGKLVGGMGNSNGEMAEEYFFNSFKADKTFANERYYKVRRNQVYRKEEIKAEFDLVLLNGKSAVLIEVKYNAKPDNISIEKIISRIKYFKILYPECKNFNIYLGVAAMSFKEGLETELHQAGIATIRPVGKKMVKFDKDVKVF